MKKLITIFLVIVISVIIALIIFSYLRDKKTKSILTAGIVQGTEVNLASKISGLRFRKNKSVLKRVLLCRSR
ncbi:MAG: hypothetical protein Q8N09_05020 [Thermodesulfovibrionia bacterium]|nr:hypothetical protein [Thermodesulfovibrionia bacterium]